MPASQPQPHSARLQFGTAGARLVRSANEIRVGLLGYGNVGSAVDRLLNDQSGEIERTLGLRVQVTRALVRDLHKPRDYPPRPGLLGTDFAAILDDRTIDVAVEVMGGLYPTERYVRELLAAGKPVITANKQLLATRGGELAEAALRTGTTLRFEAAVCGAVPVVRTICEGLPVGSVRRIRGIFNGTTNFILTRIEQGESFQSALAEAQNAGYAEADPQDDISGTDAAAKLALLATIAFGTRVELCDVGREGIDDITATAHAVHAARKRGRRVRLVAEAERVDGAVRARVGPTVLAEDDPLASVPGAFNEVVLEGTGFQELRLRGLGAGGVPTASAVIADLLNLLKTGAGTAIWLLPKAAAEPLEAANA